MFLARRNLLQRILGPFSLAAGLTPSQSAARAHVGGSGADGTGYSYLVPNIAALRSLTTTTKTGSKVNVVGYYSAANNAAPDGGGGVFVYNAADTSSADDGGTIIVDAAGRRWKATIH